MGQQDLGNAPAAQVDAGPKRMVEDCVCLLPACVLPLPRGSATSQQYSSID